MLVSSARSEWAAGFDEEALLERFGGLRQWALIGFLDRRREEPANKADGDGR